MIATQNLEVGEVKSQNLTLDSVKTKDIDLLFPSEVVILENEVLNEKYASGEIKFSVTSVGGEGDKTTSNTKELIFTELAKKYDECVIEFDYYLNPNSYGGGSLTVGNKSIVPYPPQLTSGTYARNDSITIPVNNIVSTVYARSFSSASTYISTMGLIYKKITLRKA